MASNRPSLKQSGSISVYIIVKKQDYSWPPFEFRLDTRILRVLTNAFSGAQSLSDGLLFLKKFLCIPDSVDSYRFPTGGKVYCGKVSGLVL